MKESVDVIISLYNTANCDTICPRFPFVYLLFFPRSKSDLQIKLFSPLKNAISYRFIQMAVLIPEVTNVTEVRPLHTRLSVFQTMRFCIDKQMEISTLRRMSHPAPFCGAFGQFRLNPAPFPCTWAPGQSGERRVT